MICDYSAVIDYDWFREIEITKPFGNMDEDLYLPINYKEYGSTPYENGFLGNSVETLFLDEDTGEYILRVAETIPVNGVSFSWIYSWFKSTKSGTAKMKRAIEEYEQILNQGER